MKKIKALISILLIGVLMFSVLGCTSTTGKDVNKTNTESQTITVVDNNGNSVTVPKEINRIVVCDIFPLPSVLSVFFDSAKKIVGMAPTSMSAAQNSLLSELYPEILDAQTDFMTGTDVNIEELLKLKPDVVFYSASSTELGENLKKAGLSAVAISANKWQYNAIETLNNWIILLSEIFQNNDKAAKVETYSNDIYNMVQERVKNIPEKDKRNAFFLFQYDESMIMTSGQQFFGQWWADAIGAKNVATELTKDNSVAVNIEQIYKWNPDLIFITNFNKAQPQDLYNDSIGTYNWSEVSAVKNKSVYKMPLGMYRSYTPGVDTPITLIWLAKTAYPSLFEDIDITEKTIEYYKDVFGITLTDKQANSIFSPVSDAGKTDF